MSCGITPIFIYCGATWNDVSFDYTDDAGVIIPLTGLKARGTLTDSNGNVVLALSSIGSPATLIIDEAGGGVSPNVGSDSTQAISPTNARRELTLNLELYDDSVSPNIITPFGRYSIVAQPDSIP